jgi:Domain of unknown function (DUF4382)
MKLRHLTTILAASLAILLTACGGGDGISGTGSSAGSLRVSLTDAPACGYDEVNVTVKKVRVHQNIGAAETDPGWSEIVLAPARRFDLLTLRNGVLVGLGETPLPAGRYTQLRLVLADNTSAMPLANSVVPVGGMETPLDTPSAQQSGLKLNVDIDVPADKVVDVVLDFDACKSVVKRGNSGKFNLKPVITVIPRLADAGMRIVGYAVAASGVEVSAQQAGVPIKTTLADAADGKFVLYPVPAGSYELVVRAPGRATAVVTGVPVITTAHTTLNNALTPIVPPPLSLPLRTVGGTLTPFLGEVRAVQRFTGAGPSFEAAWSAVDETTGAYTLALPVDAPLKAAYDPNPLALLFLPDVAATGLYTLEARSNGALKTRDIDTRATVPPIDFTFP